MSHAPDLDTVLSWRGRTVRDPDGAKVGKVGELYLDDETGLPAYAGVRTGLFGHKESIVPLGGVVEHDGDLLVPFGADLVRSAPSLAPDAALTDEEELLLGRHYGIAPGENEVIRSEEEVRVGVSAARPQERVRLRKVLVTEEVPVVEQRRKEVVKLETEPPPAGRIESVEDVDRR